MNRLALWSFGLVLLLLIMAAILTWVRRKIGPGEQLPSKGFTLGDLRELHRTGKMTDAEFEAAKGLILQDLKQANNPEKQNRTSNRPNAS